MCGIAGMYSIAGAPVDRSVLGRMTDAIAHRGPDGRGLFVDGPVGLGNRRLAIIDLSEAAAQPIGNEVGDVVLTYNGELYNFRELRTELERTGHVFRSRTDSEVVVHAYEEWGPACVERFNGMFGLALWDGRARELFLARDRYGIKPLYYALAGETLLFASEIKAFLEHPAFRAELSLPHLLQYFTFQNAFDDGTLFAGVRVLPPGHRMLVRAAGGPPAPERYWDFAFTEPEQPGSLEEYQEELDRLLRRAVERQLVSDVPVGAYLSGGMDSGSITALAARALPYLSTFTVGFDLTSASGLELGFDERARAERMSYLFKTEHYEAVLKAGDMTRCLPSLVWHLEDLRVGQSYPNYYVARLASKFVKVVLSGTGGDELFAGYPWRYYRAVVNDDFEHYVEKYYRFWHRLLPNRTMPELFQPDVWREIGRLRTIDTFRAVLPDQAHAPESPEEYLNASLYLEARTFLHGLLVVEDKLAMAHGLETRVPFLDNDLVDFAQQVPAALKLRHLEEVVGLNENEPGEKTERYFRKTGEGKVLLRQVLGRHVPDSVEGAKQGFSGPDASWFRGESIDYVREIVHRRDSLIYEFLRPETVQALVDEHFHGRENRRLLLWSLLNFEHWCRIFLAGRPEPAFEAVSAGEAVP
jgi:asparagine synthase (glutamine-hydrolysing)